MSPVYHETTRREIDQYLKQPAHAVALIGDRGIGKRYVADRVAAALLSVPVERLMHEPHLLVLEPDEKGTIGIEQARNMVSRLQLKTTGTKPIRRVVLIDGAEALTNEAQNALLKAIEEPPEDTAIICTVSDKTALLPTVLSRLQTIQVHLPANADLLKEFTAASFTDDAVQSAIRLSGGLPGLTHALLTNQDSHPLVAAINEAKALLRSDSFERLRMVDDIANGKRTAEVVQSIGYIADVALQANTSDSGIKRWAQIQTAAYEAAEQLRANANAKLVLSNLFLRV